MNETELLQLMIVNAVKEGVDKALQPIKEELTKIKALNAKILKEQANLVQAKPIVEQQAPAFRPIGRPASLQEQAYTSHAQDKVALEAFKAQAAPFLHADGALPDIDIPVGLLLKKR